MLAIHPRGMFERLLGATTLSATYGTLCPFSSPQRAVLAPNGLIYVSDSGNNRIQALTPDGSSHPFTDFSHPFTYFFGVKGPNGPGTT